MPTPTKHKTVQARILAYAGQVFGGLVRLIKRKKYPVLVPACQRLANSLFSNNHDLNYAMNHKIEIEGRWWVNGLESPAHYGVLTYEPSSGISLSVKIPQEGGAAEAIEILAGQGFNVPQTVFGRDKNNHPISLYGCSVGNFNSSGGLRSYRISAQICLNGRTVETWDDVAYDHINVELSLFHNWLGLSNINREKGDEIRIKIADRNLIEVEIKEGVRLVIWPTLQYNETNSSVVMAEGHGLEFKFVNEVQAKESLLKYADSVRRFLTLLVNRPVFVDKVYFHPKDGEDPHAVSLLKSNPGAEEAERKLLSPNMLVSYSDIHDQFQQVISKWYKLEDTLGDVLNLYFATIFVPGLYLHQTFLFLAQALEVYHRTSPNFENQVQPKADFKARKKRIIEKVPAEKDWLNEKLGHANEKTLAQRLDELIASHQNTVDRFIDDTKAFSTLIRHTRNHYTHYGTSEESMDKVASGVGFIGLADKMRTLLEICIFSDLGISGAPIDRMIKSLKDRQYFQI